MLVPDGRPLTSDGNGPSKLELIDVPCTMIPEKCNSLALAYAGTPQQVFLIANGVCVKRHRMCLRNDNDIGC